MDSNHWPSGEAPPEAYLRVTKPERFAPLYDVANVTLDSLMSTFRVQRTEGYGLDLELERRYKLARPTVKLLPKDPLAAPIVVAFSAFPGLHVRFGRWYLTAFPNCGCDACAETAEREGERLRSLVGNVVAGRFRETICIPASGDPWTETEFWYEKRLGLRAQDFPRSLPVRSHAERLSARSRLDRAHAEQLVAESGRTSYDWVEWPRLGYE